MLGNRRPARAEIRRDSTHRPLPGPQQPQDLPPRRVGNRPKDRLRLLPRNGNHMVTINVTNRLQYVKTCVAEFARIQPAKSGLVEQIRVARPESPRAWTRPRS